MIDVNIKNGFEIHSFQSSASLSIRVPVGVATRWTLVEELEETLSVAKLLLPLTPSLSSLYSVLCTFYSGVFCVLLANTQPSYSYIYSPLSSPLSLSLLLDAKLLLGQIYTEYNITHMLIEYSFCLLKKILLLN